MFLRSAFRSRLAGLVALVALGVAGCGDDDSSDRDSVKRYITDVNAVQARAEPRLRTANSDYARFAEGQLSPGKALAAVQANHNLIRKIRHDVASVPAPREARRLRSLLLKVFDANSVMATQTTLTARYIPAEGRTLRGLRELNRDLQQALKPDSGTEGQADGLMRYAQGLRGVLERLRALRPPAILALAHRDHVRRAAAARRVALQLREAILARDNPRIDARLSEFRRINLREADPREARAAYRRYLRTYKAVARAQQAVYRELARLEKTLDG